jgi:serine/threonine protein kinase
MLEIKRNIRVAFKRDSKAPDPNFKYYKIGRLLGRGSFGKVNLALHKLTRKLVAVKSINKKIFLYTK